MTIYGYMRVSTDEQSTALQLDALRAAGVELANVYSDEGVSGASVARERRELSKLLATMRPGDVLTVYSVSRVGRSTLDVLTLLEALGKRGVLFRSLTEPFDTTTPMGEFVLTILAAVARLERRVLSERTRDGLAATRARGTTLGRPSSRTSSSPEAKARCCEELAAGVSANEAARRSGVSRKTAQRLVRSR